MVEVQLVEALQAVGASSCRSELNYLMRLEEYYSEQSFGLLTLWLCIRLAALQAAASGCLYELLQRRSQRIDLSLNS